MRPLRKSLSILLAGAGALSATQATDLRTRAEATAFEHTSRYEDVRAVLDRLAAAQPRLVHVTSFGASEEGRRLPLAVLGSPAPGDAAAARRTDRVRVLVLGAIHGGEVEGKEAALLLARRLGGGDLRRLLDRITVLLAPLYNADGNERISVDHRPDQFGPVGGVGTRENARGLDLNRDFVKLEAAESRHLVALIAAWDPHVVIDLHTTNGSYHGYHLTYAPTLAVNADPELAQVTRHLLESARQVLADRGWRSYSYGNFVSEGALDRVLERPQSGAPAWRTFDARPRFVTNGVGLRNRIAILSEAYSYLGFERRVRVTEAFVETLLALIARRAPALAALTARIDRATAEAGARGALGPFGTRGTLTPRDGAVRILVGDVDSRPHPATGRPMTTMRESTARPTLMQDYASFAPAGLARVPRAYVVPAGQAHGRLAARIGALLDRHGIAFERLIAPARLQVEAATPARVTFSEQAVQGHHPVELSGLTWASRAVDVPQGSLRVSMGQPLARLAFHLLEPASDDGVVTWNMVDDWLGAGIEVPIYRVVD